MTDRLAYPIIPWPRSVEPRPGAFTPRSPIVISVGAGGPVVAGDDRISIAQDAGAPTGDESYVLDIAAERITLRARDRRGLLHGSQTLGQLVAASPQAIPAARIDDAPRFPYRGLHLDVGRHFFPVEFIKKYIDVMANFKLNTFHWHLTEDQGWRLEIKKYPKLTTVGAWRAETIVGHAWRGPSSYDGTRHGGFYTQNQARDVVA